jgi:hypothetical protein
MNNEENRKMEPQKLPETTESKTDILATQTALLTHNQATTPKTSQGVYELPCGYLDEGGNLFTEVALKEITGSEEDLLANPKMQPVKKINELLTRCVQRLGPYTERGRISQVVLDLTVGDRAFMMFAVRRISLGDDYPFKDKCPSCETEKLYTVDLSELEPRKMPDPKKRSFDEILPSGKPCRFHPMTGKDEERLAKFDKNKADTLSLSILMRLDSLENKAPTLQDVKDLGLRDRNFLRDQFEDTEGGLDTEVELECPDCGEQFKRDVDVGQQGFFFPSAIQKSLKAKSST